MVIGPKMQRIFFFFNMTWQFVPRNLYYQITYSHLSSDLVCSPILGGVSFVLRQVSHLPYVSVGIGDVPVSYTLISL